MEGNCITSKGPAKLLPSTQKLYRITYIFCKALWSVFIQPFDTNLLARKATLTLQLYAQPKQIIQTIHIHFCLPCNHVTNLLAYYGG